MTGSPNVVRLAHLSDVHIDSGFDDWHRRDWFSKRLTGLVNARLGRGRRFRLAEKVLTALAADLHHDRKPDWVIFSGDATTMGFRSELERATALLGVNDLLGGLAVPGNHDYYTPAAEAAGYFEVAFRTWQTGERLDGATYPFAQRVGPLWLVGVNSCRGNRWPWDASGRVGAAQLDRLRRLLAALAPGPRILVTHYPVGRANGSPEVPAHGLRDLAELRQIAAEGGVCLWLHGHRHDAYVLNDAQIAPFPTICAGSATQAQRWSYNEYTIADGHLLATRRTYDPEEGRFRDGLSFELRLREP